MPTWPDSPPPRLLVYHILRNGEALCPGLDMCGGVQRCDEFGNVDPFPEPCPECLLPDFEHCRSHTNLGLRVGLAWETLNLAELGIAPSYEDLTAREFNLIKIIRTEQDKHQQEQSNRPQNS